ncbi:MAG: hemerythrin family protein [Magnetococcales bacterium]|nr:hemerythrin family protein [Magnetococcales bacterium]
MKISSKQKEPQYKDRRKANWKRLPLTKNEIFDEQHQYLVEIMVDLRHHIENKRSPEFIQGVLTCMEKSFLRYFSMQEHLMELAGYPGREKHSDKHREFVINYFTEVRNNLPDLDAQGIEKLIRWLATHIYNEDKTMSAYLETSNGAEQR